MNFARAMRVVLGAGVLVLSLSATPRAIGQEDKSRPAELKVLDRWIGDWDMEVTIKPTRDLPQGSKTTYRNTVRWTLNDRFVRCDGEGQGQEGDQKLKSAFSWIITHDPQIRAYTSTVFWANVRADGWANWGGGQRGTATWDEQAQTLTTRTEHAEGGPVEITVTQWIDADTHRWVSSMTDRNGKVLNEMTAMAKRRK